MLRDRPQTTLSGRDEIGDVELLALIAEQRRDDLFGHRIPARPFLILAGLNPNGLKACKPRYFMSGRSVIRRPQGRKGAAVVCGTASMYRRGCRCEQCRRAQSVRRKAQWAVEKEVRRAA